MSGLEGFSFWLQLREYFKDQKDFVSRLITPITHIVALIIPTVFLTYLRSPHDPPSRVLLLKLRAAVNGPCPGFREGIPLQTARATMYYVQQLEESSNSFPRNPFIACASMHQSHSHRVYVGPDCAYLGCVKGTALNPNPKPHTLDMVLGGSGRLSNNGKEIGNYYISFRA